MCIERGRGRKGERESYQVNEGGKHPRVRNCSGLRQIHQHNQPLNAMPQDVHLQSPPFFQVAMAIPSIHLRTAVLVNTVLLGEDVPAMGLRTLGGSMFLGKDAGTRPGICFHGDRRTLFSEFSGQCRSNFVRHLKSRGRLGSGC